MPPSLAPSELIRGQDTERHSPVPASSEPFCSLGSCNQMERNNRHTWIPQLQQGSTGFRGVVVEPRS